MKSSPNPATRHPFAWLLFLWALAGATHAVAGDKWLIHAYPGVGLNQERHLILAYPGDELDQGLRPKKTKLSKWVASQLWTALSVRDGVLFVEPVTETTESDWITVSGNEADRALEGKVLKRSPKRVEMVLKSPSDAVVLARIDLGIDGSRSLNPGQYPGYIAPAVLREGWTASAEVAGRKWKFYTRHQKRPDGRMLAGSLEIMADDLTNATTTVLLPPASGMAFAKQELLWLGDIDGDAEPDLLLKRTLLTGHIDIVLVVEHLRGFAHHDPDLPTTYFSSGVEPESNGFRWNRKRPAPDSGKFVNHGAFSIDEREWLKKLYPDAFPDDNATGESPAMTEAAPRKELELPVLMADRQFKLKGETIRFTLEYLPRAKREGPSSGNEGYWGGDVLVRAFFRGKSQVLMETSHPDSGLFELSVGMINGEPSVRVNHTPHYNNSFTSYWIYDQAESRFRRLASEHSQGC